jgi:tRNA dimethylallyltransferase
MDIGTAKPTALDRETVAHHCLDWWDVSEPASVAVYQKRARATVLDICTRGGLPVVVGGSPLYVRALCDELDLPPRDPQIRRRLEQEAIEQGPASLYERLRQAAPAAAADIDPRNVRRVIRALEVVELTGTFRARLPEPTAWLPTVFLAPRRERPELDDRIARRTRQMWDHGLLGEVAALMDQGLAEAPTASRAVGYPQAMDHLAQRVSAEEAMEATTRATRALARRQERTFRGDVRVQWVDPDDADLAVTLIEAWDQGQRR